MHTLSGRVFELGSNYTPTIADVAVGLSRIPRWAGATLVPWSVLQHSLACFRLASGNNAKVQLYALWHDCEEMATGDIPSPFKAPEQRALAQQLREWMYQGVLGLRYPTEGDRETVKGYDNLLRHAEAHCFCHPRVRQDFPADSTEWEWVMKAADAIWSLFDVPVHLALEEFERETNRLLVKLGSRTGDRKALKS